jgi:hypothetical protein
MLPSTANRFVLAVCGLLVRVSDIATLLGKDAVIAAIAKKATAAITKPETYEQKPTRSLFDCCGITCLQKRTCCAPHLTLTFGSTDIPRRNRWFGSWPASKTILTGMRCTTLTKLPVAFSGGKRLKSEPVAPAMLRTCPL